MLTNNTPFVDYFKANVNPTTIFQTNAEKEVTALDGSKHNRKYVFLHFNLLDGSAKQACVSEAAEPLYTAGQFEQLEVSQIVDEMGVISPMLSINKRAANKQKVTFSFF